jgi:hypothetical protein
VYFNGGCDFCGMRLPGEVRGLIYLTIKEQTVLNKSGMVTDAFFAILRPSLAFMRIYFKRKPIIEERIVL